MRKLGRAPKRYEERILSLSDIPLRLDEAVDILKAQLPPLLLAQDFSTLTGVVTAIMSEIARFGASEVRRECERQGASLSMFGESESIEGFDPLVVSLTEDLAEEAAVIGILVRDRLKRRKLSTEKRLAALGEQLEAKFVQLTGKYARRAVNEAFAIGRASEMDALATSSGVFSLAKGRTVRIEDVIQTAILDRSTCEECAAVDGEIMQFGDARQQELMPPYYKCKGGDNCRCVQLAVLGDGTVIEIVDGEVVDQDD